MPRRKEPRRPHQVHASGVISKALEALQHRAERQGRGKEALAAIQAILRQLQQNPNNVGEPLYRLPGLRMQVRTVVVSPLAVDFGVCEGRPLVFLRGVQLLSLPSP